MSHEESERTPKMPSAFALASIRLDIWKKNTKLCTIELYIAGSRFALDRRRNIALALSTRNKTIGKKTKYTGETPVIAPIAASAARKKKETTIQDIASVKMKIG